MEVNKEVIREVTNHTRIRTSTMVIDKEVIREVTILAIIKDIVTITQGKAADSLKSIQTTTISAINAMEVIEGWRRNQWTKLSKMKRRMPLNAPQRKLLRLSRNIE